MTNRIIRPILFVFSAACIVLVGLTILLQSFVSPELVRSAFQRELSNFTGQNIVLNGAIDVRLLPTPMAHVTNVIIPSKTATNEPFLEVETVRARITWFSLITGKPQFTGLQFDRPRLNLVRLADGSLNWEEGFGRITHATHFARQAISKTQNSGDPSALKPDVLLPAGFRRTLGNLVVTGGSITVRDRSGDLIVEATSLKGSVGWPDFTAPIVSTGSGIIRGVPISFSVKADEPFVLLAGGTTQLKINLESEIANIDYTGILGFYDSMFADGALSLDLKSLSAFLDFTQTEVAPGRAIKTVQISSSFALNNGKGTFSDLNIAVDGNKGEGVLEIVTDSLKSPLLSGTLDFKSLDLASFLGAFIPLPDRNFQSSETIDLSFISEVRTDLRVSAATAKFGDFAFSDVAATAQINENAALFDLGNAQAYGGELQARLQILKQEDHKKGQFSFSAQNIDIISVTDTLKFPEKRVSGTATFLLDATVIITDWATMARTATSTTNLTISKGTTLGFGANRLLSSDDSSEFFTLAGDEPQSEAFENVTLEGTFAAGVMAIKNAEIVYPSGKVSFHGVAPFRSGGIALTAKAIPNGQDGAATSRRYFVGGTWAKPFATSVLQPLP